MVILLLEPVRANDMSDMGVTRKHCMTRLNLVRRMTYIVLTLALLPSYGIFDLEDPTKLLLIE